MLGEIEVPISPAAKIELDKLTISLLQTQELINSAGRIIGGQAKIDLSKYTMSSEDNTKIIFTPIPEKKE